MHSEVHHQAPSSVTLEGIEIRRSRFFLVFNNKIITNNIGRFKHFKIL